MSFTAAGVQSGVDADLSGVTAITGVTFVEIDGVTWYIMGNVQLQINGTVTHDPEYEKLFFGDACPPSTIQINNGGVYNFGVPIIDNGYTRYSEQLGIYVGGDNRR